MYGAVDSITHTVIHDNYDYAQVTGASVCSCCSYYPTIPYINLTLPYNTYFTLLGLQYLQYLTLPHITLYYPTLPYNTCKPTLHPQVIS